MNGIDCSKHNGVIDWEKVAKNVDFAILRAGYGRLVSQKDAKFEENYKGCKNNNVPVGAYWYSYARTAAEAEKEALTCLEVIKGKKFEYPIYFDIEDKTQASLSKSVITDMCIAFCSTLEKHGYYVGIYANPDWFTNKIDLEKVKNYDKWLAHWTNKPKWGNEFGGLWQYSEKGKVDGISGNVDMNKSYRDYPNIIKNAKLNDYGSYTVTATQSGLTKEKANETAVYLRKIGMTVEIK